MWIKCHKNCPVELNTYIIVYLGLNVILQSMLVARHTTSFNINKLCFSAKSVTCVILKTNIDFFLNSINWLIFLEDMHCVFCDVETAF